MDELEELLPEPVLLHPVIPVAVCPLEHPAALGDLLHSLEHELQLGHRGVLQVTQPQYLRLPHFGQVLRRLGLRRAVSRPPLVVVGVPLQRLLRRRPSLLLLARALLLPGLGVLVARVVTARALPVFAPFAAAHPAKLKLALRADHVHAPQVLLYGPLARRARFGVGQDPVHVLGLGAVLHEPLLNRLAVHRAVCILLAGPAERRAASAVNVHRTLAPVPVAQHRHLAPGARAPLHAGVIVYPRPPLEHVQPFGALSLQVPLGHRLGHPPLAPLLRAPQVQDAGTV